MKKSDSMIARLWRKLGGSSKTAESAANEKVLKRLSTEAGAPQGARKRPQGGIEMLEGRIAPASLVSPSTVTYTDVDGDLVTIKFSKNLFKTTGTATELTTLLNSVFKFSVGSVVTDGSDPGTPQQLQMIDLTKLPTSGVVSAQKSVGAGVSFTVTAVKSGTEGDGLVNVGYINASSTQNSFGLGKITIDGDLGQIDCGESKTAVGLKALKVNSLGAVTGTQPTGSGFPNLESTIVGTVGSLTVLTDVKDSYFHVVNGSGFGGVKAVGKIGKISIAGSLIGNQTNATSSDNTGVIQADSAIGSVKIGSGGADDGIIGGNGRNAGSVIASGKIGSVVIDGNMVGNDGANSGSILGNGGIGSVKVTGSLKVAATATQGGAGLSASIESGGDLGSVNISGSILAGVGEGSGTITAAGKIGSISIAGDLVGNGARTGGISGGEKINSISIGGDLRGGTGFFSGFIQGTSDIGSVKIGGDLESNATSAAERNAVIVANGSLQNVTIDGSILGGSGVSSGSINAGLSGQGGLGSLIIGKKIVGGSGENSASIVSEGTIRKLIVNGEGDTAVQGGLGRFSAAIYSGSGIDLLDLNGHVIGSGEGSASIQTVGLLKKLTVSGDLRGGTGIGSASIKTLDDLDRGLAGELGTISIDGKLMAGRGANSASLHSDGDIHSVKIGEISVGTFDTGAAGADSCSIVSGLGSIDRGDVDSIAVGGAINGLTADHLLVEIRGSLGGLVANGGIANGEIHVADKIGSITTGTTGRNAVDGNLENVLITAGSILPASAKQALSIARITVNGDVSNSRILAGYDLDTIGANGDAQIGAVKISGNWAASDLVAGGLSINGEFGDSDDVAIPTGSAEVVSRIASLVIGGTVTGTNAIDTDHFGFVAQQIGTVKVGGSSSPNLPGDVSVRILSIA